jgi:hypothetical protein
MASTPLLGLALPVDGATNWGTLVNTSITTLLDSAISGTTTLSTDANVTLTTTLDAANQARQAVLLCTGARTAARTIIAPARSKTYVVVNNTTGGFNVRIAGVGPTTGVTVPSGRAFLVAWNGSDFVVTGVAVVDLATEVSGVLPVANGGTGLTSYTSGGVLFASSPGVITDSANLTFDGAKLNVRGVTIGPGASAVATNIAIGTSALSANTTGSQNTAVGHEASYSNTGGVDNSSFGTAALYSNTNGSYNTAIGNGALYLNTTGGSNTAVGRSALLFNGAGANNTAVGENALRVNSASNNTAVGYQSAYSTTSGANNLAVGYLAGYNLVSGSNNTIIGNNAQASTTSISNEITLGNSSVTTLRCQVTSITSLSDQRDKHSIEDLPVGLALVNALRPRRYKWDRRDWYVNEVKREDGGTDFVPVPQDGSRAQDVWNEGFVAQEAKAALEAAGASWFPLVYETNPEKLEMSAGKLIPVLVKAIQELTARLEVLEAE